jgi:3-phenylpropionate/cinnamic acid dioxygenase small subunit
MADPNTERIAAELEIRNVLAQFARLADTGDTDTYVQFMTPDIVWSMPANPGLGLPASERHGRDEIATGQRERTAAGVQGEGSNTMHLVTTTLVDVQSDDAATADSYFMFVTATTTTPSIQNVGRYHDEFRRTPEGWKLARREIQFG